MDIPLWFGPSERPLFAFATVPDDGRASGAVVLCPPLGLEAVCARRTFGLLADALAASGILTIRFDYDGTGDSAGSDADPDRITSWLRGVQDAVDLARRTGVPKVAVVGMRLGATLAATALSKGAGDTGESLVDGLVLWDPCGSGRSYLRAQRALRAFSLGAVEGSDGSVEAPGVVFNAETVAALSVLDLGALEGSLAERILVLSRKGQSTGTGALGRFAAERPVEEAVAYGQEQLVDVKPDAARVPRASVDALADWLRHALDGAPTPVSVPRRLQTVMWNGSAGPLVERIVRLGPLGLFGIVTEPQAAAGAGRVSGPTVVFLNAGVIDHAGPARLWVELSRRWAGLGIRSVRCDLSGLGYSPVRPGQAVDESFPPEAIEDVVEVASAVSPEDPSDVVLVGLCSGGYHAIEGALMLGAAGVCGVNAVVPHKLSELNAEDTTMVKEMDARRQAAAPSKWWIRALPAHDQLGALVDRMPGPMWWFVNRIAVAQSPAQPLRKLVEGGVRTLMVSGERESYVIWRGESRTRRQLERSGLLHLVVLPDIDHELLKRDARELVGDILTDDLLNAYVTPGTDR